MWIPVLKENPEFQEWYPKVKNYIYKIIYIYILSIDVYCILYIYMFCTNIKYIILINRQSEIQLTWENGFIQKLKM